MKTDHIGGKENMTRMERLFVITVFTMWALLPDIIPGPIDDVIAGIVAIHQSAVLLELTSD